MTLAAVEAVIQRRGQAPAAHDKTQLESRAVAWHTRRMNSVTLEYPSAWLAPLGTDAVRFAREAKLAAAMKLFETGRFTSGQAARFAGMERVAFLLSCRQWGVDSVQWDDAELAAEFATPLPDRA